MSPKGSHVFVYRTYISLSPPVGSMAAACICVYFRHGAILLTVFCVHISAGVKLLLDDSSQLPLASYMRSYTVLASVH